MKTEAFYYCITYVYAMNYLHFKLQSLNRNMLDELYQLKNLKESRKFPNLPRHIVQKYCKAKKKKQPLKLVFFSSPLQIYLTLLLQKLLRKADERIPYLGKALH